MFSPFLSYRAEFSILDESIDDWTDLHRILQNAEEIARIGEASTYNSPTLPSQDAQLNIISDDSLDYWTGFDDILQNHQSQPTCGTNSNSPSQLNIIPDDSLDHWSGLNSILLNNEAASSVSHIASPPHTPVDQGIELLNSPLSTPSLHLSTIGKVDDLSDANRQSELNKTNKVLEQAESRKRAGATFESRPSKCSKRLLFEDGESASVPAVRNISLIDERLSPDLFSDWEDDIPLIQEPPSFPSVIDDDVTMPFLTNSGGNLDQINSSTNNAVQIRTKNESLCEISSTTPELSWTKANDSGLFNNSHIIEQNSADRLHGLLLQLEEANMVNNLTPPSPSILPQGEGWLTSILPQLCSTPIERPSALASIVVQPTVTPPPSNRVRIHSNEGEGEGWLTLF